MKSVAFLALLCVALSTATWTSLCSQSSNCPSIMMSVSCKDDSLCAIVGGFSNTPEGVYWSADGFKTFTRANMESDSLMLMDLSIDQNGNGATAGMGLGNNSGLLYSTDVKTWTHSTDVNFMVGQSMSEFGNGEFGFVGTLNNLGNVQGVLISQDHGKDWTPGAWPADISNFTEARYGAFPSDKVLYVTGGQWPSNNSTRNRMKNNCYEISAKTCVPASHMAIEGQKFHRAVRRAQQGPSKDGYRAIITKSVDGGKTWETQLKDTSGFYFNDISCIDENNCLAVGEGFTDGPAPGARIYQTTDGKNWNRIFFSQETGASMMRVHMLSSTEAWAAGGYVKSGTAYGTFYHTTDGGKTWNLETAEYVGDVMGLHMTSPTSGYAVGITEFQTSTVLKYSA